MHGPKLTIQIVTWNSASVLEGGLRALARIPRGQVDICCIDNNSRDTSLELVKKILPTARIIHVSENIGFAGAHNVGFALCATPYVLTHDPDMEMNTEAIFHLLQVLEKSSCAAIQGKIYRSEGENILDSAGITMTLSCNGRERGAGEVDRGQFNRRDALLAVSGCCGIYRVSALTRLAYGHYTVAGHEALEVFDKTFFAYKEDVDLGWRMNNAGYTVLFEPIDQGTHRRTLGRRGFLNWGVDPTTIYRRLQSPRTRYSLRNWCWMIAKNASYRQLLIRELFVDMRLFVFFLLSLSYWPLLSVWPEIIRGLPAMMEKRKV